MYDTIQPYGLACQDPLSMGFSRQEYWSGLPCPLPGDLSDSGSNPCLLCLLHWQAGSLPLVPPGKPMVYILIQKHNKCVITYNSNCRRNRSQWLSGKETACIWGDLGSILGWGRSPGEANVNPLQYSCLENSMDKRAIVHGVTKKLSD